MFDSDAKSSAASRRFFLKEKKKEKFKERREGRIGLEAELLLLLLLRYIDISIQLGTLISSRFEKYIIYLLQLIVRDISVYYFVV